MTVECNIYDWDTSGDFPAAKIEQYWVNIGDAVRKRNEGADDYDQYEIGNIMNKIEKQEIAAEIGAKEKN